MRIGLDHPGLLVGRSLLPVLQVTPWIPKPAEVDDAEFIGALGRFFADKPAVAKFAGMIWALRPMFLRGQNLTLGDYIQALVTIAIGADFWNRSANPEPLSFEADLTRRCPEWANFVPQIRRLRDGCLVQSAEIADIDFLEGVYIVAKYAPFLWLAREAS